MLSWKAFRILLLACSQDRSGLLLNDEYLGEFTEYVQRLKNCYPCIIDMYMVGNCAAPGVSDIDTIMVLKNGTRRWLWEALPTAQYGYSHIFHGPFVTTEDYLPELLEVTTLKINQDVGDGQRYFNTSQNEVRNWQLDIVRTSLFLWHFNQRVKDIINFGKTSERYFLLVTNSFSYTLKAVLELSSHYNIATGYDGILTGYTNLVEESREFWVNNEMGKARSGISMIASSQQEVISVVNEVLNLVVGEECGLSTKSGLFDLVRNQTRLLTLSKLEVIPERSNIETMGASLDSAMDIFSSSIANHVHLYRRRNVELYGAEFPLPGLGIDKASSRRTQVLSKVLRKFRRGPMQ